MPTNILSTKLSVSAEYVQKKLPKVQEWKRSPGSYNAALGDLAIPSVAFTKAFNALLERVRERLPNISADRLMETLRGKHGRAILQKTASDYFTAAHRTASLDGFRRHFPRYKFKHSKTKRPRMFFFKLSKKA